MKTLFSVVVATLVMGLASHQVAAQTGCPGKISSHVAIIGSPWVINGGNFPTSGSDLVAFTFSNLAPGSVNLANLANFDTVLLNVSSSQMDCDVNTLSTQAKAELVSWVAAGNKLIIYDSECSPQDYSWLPYPFATENPGALGARGTLVDLQDDSLSSNDSASPSFVNAACLSSGTDAVGDANVMTTLDPEWKIDMTAANAIGFTGPVHTYAEYPSVSANPNPSIPRGLIIYNGLDVDFLGNATCEPNGLRKIWVLELQQPFSPSCLVPGPSVTGLDLNPPSQSLLVGQQATVVARVHDQLNNPISGILISFSILSGPNTGAEATGLYSPVTRISGAIGEVSFTYTGSGGTGQDVIVASFTAIGGQVVTSAPANVIWDNPPSAPPVLTKAVAGNRGYYRLTASSSQFNASALQVFIADTGSSQVAGPFASGLVFRIVRRPVASVGPGTVTAAATISVVGNATAYAVDPQGVQSTSVLLTPSL